MLLPMVAFLYDKGRSVITNRFKSYKVSLSRLGEGRYKTVKIGLSSRTKYIYIAIRNDNTILGFYANCSLCNKGRK